MDLGMASRSRWTAGCYPADHLDEQVSNSLLTLASHTNVTTTLWSTQVVFLFLTANFHFVHRYSNVLVDTYCNYVYFPWNHISVKCPMLLTLTRSRTCILGSDMKHICTVCIYTCIVMASSGCTWEVFAFFVAMEHTALKNKYVAIRHKSLHIDCSSDVLQTSFGNSLGLLSHVCPSSKEV